MAVGKIRTLVDPLAGRRHDRLEEGRGIHDHDTQKAAVDIVCKPKARHVEDYGPEGALGKPDMFRYVGVFTGSILKGDSRSRNTV